MFYFSKNKDLYASEVFLIADGIIEISKEEYDRRIERARRNREIGETVADMEEW